jgi:hypothetical protein
MALDCRYHRPTSAFVVIKRAVDSATDIHIEFGGVSVLIEGQALAMIKGTAQNETVFKDQKLSSVKCCPQ